MPKKELIMLSLRLPVDLAQRVRAAAEFDRRSVNSEIVYLLDKALSPSKSRKEVSS